MLKGCLLYRIFFFVIMNGVQGGAGGGTLKSHQIAMRNIQDPLFKSGKPAGAVPPPRESPRAVETAILPAMSTGREQNPEDCHTLG